MFPWPTLRTGHFHHSVFKMKYLLAVGVCYLDTILDVDHYPREDEKLRASNMIKRRGGNCPNTLEVLQQLLDTANRASSITLALCTVLPSSSSSGYREIVSSLPSAVDLTNCICRQDNNDPASCYIIRSRESDSRTIVNHNSLEEMSEEEFASVADGLGKEMGWCHFEVSIQLQILTLEKK